MAFPYQQILLLTMVLEAGAQSSSSLVPTGPPPGSQSPSQGGQKTYTIPTPCFLLPGTHTHCACTWTQMPTCSSAVPGCEGVRSGMTPLGKWEDVPRPCCEWAPVPGAVGMERGAACLVAVETGWLRWGSGAQAWQLELEQYGSSKGQALMPMVGG